MQEKWCLPGAAGHVADRVKATTILGTILGRMNAPVARSVSVGEAGALWMMAVMATGVASVTYCRVTSGNESAMQR